MKFPLMIAIVAAYPLCAMAAPAGRAPQFDRLVDDFVYGTLALSPVGATGQGYHLHKGVDLDDRLDDNSTAGLAAQHALLDDIDTRLSKLNLSLLDAEQRADLDVMRNAIGAARLELDEIQSFRHNPTLYVELVGNALYTPDILHYAPVTARFGHIIKRLQQVPELILQAEANLIDAPAVWNTVAIEENAGNIDLIKSALRKDCPASLVEAYDRAAAPAVESLQAFSAWLRDTLAKKPSDWQLGKALYAKKFKYVLATGKTPEQLLAEAEADLQKTRDSMVAMAAPRTVAEALAAVAGQHATPQNFMAAATQALGTATAFVKQKNLLTLPPHANLQVIETPAFMRGSYGVGGFNAAPPLEPRLGAFYWVTPIPTDWPQARIDSKLREYNDSGLQHLTVHEAMPGHYVQAEYANDIEPRSRRLLRNIFGNGPYVEGWAVYSQQLMAEEGYLGDSPGYRLTLAKQLLRVLGNTILDVRLQTMGMTDAQAIELMTQGTYQEMEEATAKLQRAKLSSCQLPTYYAGYKGWLAVRTHYQQNHAGRSLKEFHEAAAAARSGTVARVGRLAQLMPKRVGTDVGERKVIADIEKYGWHSLNIMAEKDQPPFTFTIGLFETWQHPELIVVGLTPEAVRPILVTLTRELAAKQRRDLTALAEDLIKGAGCFVEVSVRHYREYVGYARWYYDGRYFPLYQLVWPDAEGRFPWNPRASRRLPPLPAGARRSVGQHLENFHSDCC